MFSHLLATKINVPKNRLSLIPRPRLRQVILFDEHSNVLTIKGTPNNVEIGDSMEWRDAYKMVDEANLMLFRQIVESLAVE